MIFKSCVVALLSACLFFLYTINGRVGEYPTPNEEVAEIEQIIAQMQNSDSGSLNEMMGSFREQFKVKNQK